MSTSCGLRLVHLINTQSLDIAKRESKNEDKLCLYGTGGYWTAFERSAYFLSRIFPKLESFIVNNPGYPFTIVGLSIPDRKLRRYMKSHAAHHQDIDYLEFHVTPCPTKDYGEWHTKTITNFQQVLNS